MIRKIDCKEYYILSFKELQKELYIDEPIIDILINKNKEIKIVVKKQ